MGNDSFIKQLASFLIGTAGRIIVLCAMILAVYIAVTKSFEFGRSVFYQKPMEEPPGTDIILEIDNDMSTEDVAGALLEKGLIRNELAFKVQTRLYKAKIWPGKYELNTSMTTKEIIQKMNLTESQYLDIQETSARPVDEEVLGGGEEGAENENAGGTGTEDQWEDAGTGTEE